MSDNTNTTGRFEPDYKQLGYTLDLLQRAAKEVSRYSYEAMMTTAECVRKIAEEASDLARKERFAAPAKTDKANESSITPTAQDETFRLLECDEKEPRVKTEEELRWEKATDRLDAYLDTVENRDAIQVLAENLVHLKPDEVASFVVQYQGTKDKEPRKRYLTVLHPQRNGTVMEKLGHTFAEKTEQKQAKAPKSLRYNLGAVQGTYTDPEKMDLTGWHFKAFDMDDPGSKFCKQFNLANVKSVETAVVATEENVDRVVDTMNQAYVYDPDAEAPMP